MNNYLNSNRIRSPHRENFAKKTEKPYSTISAYPSTTSVFDNTNLLAKFDISKPNGSIEISGNEITFKPFPVYYSKIFIIDKIISPLNIQFSSHKSAVKPSFSFPFHFFHFISFSVKFSAC